MNTSDTLSVLARRMAIIVGVVIVATLHLAQDVLIPVVLAGLFCFLLAPLVNFLERHRLGRIPAVLMTTAIAFSIVGMLAYVVAGQLLDLAYKLPSYKENIIAKIDSLHVPQGGPWGKVTETFTDLRKELKKSDGDPAGKAPAAAKGAAPNDPAQPEEDSSATKGGDAGKAKGSEDGKGTVIEVVNPSDTLGDFLRRAAAPVLGPIGTAAVVIVFVIFMLLKKEDLRNRVIHLAGRTRLSLTTRAIEDAGTRVSRYLLMQTVVNVIYSIPIGLGLMFIGVPNALLWAVLTAVLRFIPYIGLWIVAFFPLMLSLAVSPSWTMPMMTIGLFLVVELISSNVLEPWLYGESTGLSSVAILVAAIFWTWLWGPVGLLLAIPLTVCLAVLGKHVPALSFLDVLLGHEPSLPAPDRYYQRLLARDEMEAAKVLAEYEKITSFDHVLADLLAPAVMSAETDREDHDLDEEIYTFVLASVRKHALREELRTAPLEADDATPDVLIIPAESEGDEVVGIILGELIGAKVRTRVTAHQVLTNEKAETAMTSGAQVICISDISRHDAPRARFLGRRLRTRGCTAFVVTGLWSLDDEASNLAALAERFSADQAATNLLIARNALRGWVVEPSGPAVAPAPVVAEPSKP
jgi:predicted PurR-regulated permease PerM